MRLQRLLANFVSRLAHHSTSVIVLRTKMWECEKQAAEFETDLREAFASKHKLETEQRRSLQ